MEMRHARRERLVLPAATLVTLLILLVGCGDAPPPDVREVAFTADDVHYAPGADVGLQLRNGTEQTLGYNLCFAELQRQMDQVWEPLPDPETVCTTIQHGLEPGDSASYSKTLPAEMPEGMYRFSTSLEYREDERQETIVTEGFHVGS